MTEGWNSRECFPGLWRTENIMPKKKEEEEEELGCPQ